MRSLDSLVMSVTRCRKAYFADTDDCRQSKTKSLTLGVCKRLLSMGVPLRTALLVLAALGAAGGLAGAHEGWAYARRSLVPTE